MTNSLADFPPDRFAIVAFCACGHQAAIESGGLPADLPMLILQRSLRCAACGGRGASIRIVWTAAGGFKHSGGVAA